MIKKGAYVQVRQVVLEAEDRAENIPDVTKKTPLIMWVKGSLLNDEAIIGDEVRISTITGRIVEGTLIEENPSYNFGFGKFIPEVIRIGIDLRERLDKTRD